MQTLGWFENGSISFEWAKSAPTTFAALVIGCIAAYIAFHQWRVAKAKLNLDLFERRYAIFEATWNELSSPVWAHEVPLTNPNFTNLFPKAQFLFGPEIRDYMLEVSNKIGELWVVQQKTKSNNHIVPPDLIDKEAELLTWISDHAMTECRARFGPYLDFKNWR